MMKKFRFTLEPVLDHRERIEDEKLQAFGERRRALQQAQEELARLNGSFKYYSDALRDGHAELSTEELRWYYAHLEYLDRRITMQHAAVTQHRKETERARVDAVGAGKDRKVIEKLKEKRLTEHRAAQAAAEQRDLDDFNNRRQSSSW